LEKLSWQNLQNKNVLWLGLQRESEEMPRIWAGRSKNNADIHTNLLDRISRAMGIDFYVYFSENLANSA